MRDACCRRFNIVECTKSQGAGFYRVSEEFSPPLVDAVNKMIEAIGYSGLAMFEFRVDRQNRNMDSVGSECETVGIVAVARRRSESISRTAGTSFWSTESRHPNAVIRLGFMDEMSCPTHASSSRAPGTAAKAG